MKKELKEMMKKVFLVLCLTIVGLVSNPLNVSANEVEPKAAVPLDRIETKTYSFTAYSAPNNAGPITLTVNWRYLTSGSMVQMLYSSSSCVHDDGGTCSISSYSVSGQSFSNTNDTLIVYINMNVKYNSNTYNVRYRFQISTNVIRSKGMTSITKV